MAAFTQAVRTTLTWHITLYRTVTPHRHKSSLPAFLCASNRLLPANVFLGFDSLFFTPRTVTPLIRCVFEPQVLAMTVPTSMLTLGDNQAKVHTASVLHLGPSAFSKWQPSPFNSASSYLIMQLVNVGVTLPPP